MTTCSGGRAKTLSVSSWCLPSLLSSHVLNCGYSKVTLSSCAFSGDLGHVQITGGAGFVGSHLTDKLMMDGHEVTVVDNFFTGRKRNVEHWIGHENFELINHDVVEPLYIEGERKQPLTAH